MNYQTLLSRADAAGVFHLPAGARGDLVTAAQANGMTVFEVGLAHAHNKAEMLGTIARVMAFPAWFGINYDALLDCLADLHWCPAEGYLVLLDHCDGIHGLAGEDFATSLDIFAEAARIWCEQGIPFWCLVNMQADGIASLPDLA
ncbi:MAG: barstar family protein [Proteobacteria bacterium]|nr:barstar family protein [Pseudomonadota bacterium]HQR04991.1 barstar family protein [Rhodocyclaceae bacterium]